MSFMSNWKRPVIAAAMVCALGTGVASAYDTCYPCARTRTVVVRERVRPVRVRRRACNPCYESAPVREYRTVYIEEPRVVRYVEPVVTREVIVSTPAPCSTCP